MSTTHTGYRRRATAARNHTRRNRRYKSTPAVSGSYADAIADLASPFAITRLPDFRAARSARYRVRFSGDRSNLSGITRRRSPRCPYNQPHRPAALADDAPRDVVLFVKRSMSFIFGSRIPGCGICGMLQPWRKMKLPDCLRDVTAIRELDVAAQPDDTATLQQPVESKWIFAGVITSTGPADRLSMSVYTGSVDVGICAAKHDIAGGLSRNMEFVSDACRP